MLVLLIVGLAQVLGGVALILVGRRMRAQDRAAEKSAEAWRKTLARVLESRLDAVRAGKQRYWAPVVRYSYAGPHGQKESAQATLDGRLRFTSKKKAQAFLDRFPAGTATDAWYDPSDPNRAALDRTRHNLLGANNTVVGSILAVTGALIAALALFVPE